MQTNHPMGARNGDTNGLTEGDRLTTRRTMNKELEEHLYRAAYGWYAQNKKRFLCPYHGIILDLTSNLTLECPGCYEEALNHGEFTGAVPKEYRYE